MGRAVSALQGVLQAKDRMVRLGAPSYRGPRSRHSLLLYVCIHGSIVAVEKTAVVCGLE